jgi:hypothetical protein
MDSELIQLGRRAIKRRFLRWRDPPVELPADSVIDAAVVEIVTLVLAHSEVEPNE